MSDDGALTKISERSMVSLHLVVMLLGLAVWNVRLATRVDDLGERVQRQSDFIHEMNRNLNDQDKRIIKIEVRTRPKGDRYYEQ